MKFKVGDRFKLKKVIPPSPIAGNLDYPGYGIRTGKIKIGKVYTMFEVVHSRFGDIVFPRGCDGVYVEAVEKVENNTSHLPDFL